MPEPTKPVTSNRENIGYCFLIFLRNRAVKSFLVVSPVFPVGRRLMTSGSHSSWIQFSLPRYYGTWPDKLSWCFDLTPESEVVQISEAGCRVLSGKNYKVTVATTFGKEEPIWYDSRCLELEPGKQTQYRRSRLPDTPSLRQRGPS